MSQKQTKRLRKLCTNRDGSLRTGQYNALKANWGKVPTPARRPLMNALEAVVNAHKAAPVNTETAISNTNAALAADNDSA